MRDLLARALGPGIALTVSAAEGLPQSKRTARILVVDDDALIRTSTVALLEDLGHSVIDAGVRTGANRADINTS